MPIQNNSSWNHVKWIKEFHEASEAQYGFRELRADVFLHTVKLVKQGSYTLMNGNSIDIDVETEIANKTVFYTCPDKLETAKSHKANISAMSADCLEAAKLLQQAGMKPVVLNMANRQTPGGGVLGGAGAQEENIFRRSNLYASLYQFANFASEWDVERNPHHSYPLDQNTGGVYSPEVTVFRGTEKNGYSLLKSPFRMSFISVAAINNPLLVNRDNKLFIADNLVEPTKNKMRTILRIAGIHAHDALVLSAFGCGAFRNPPNHIASLFHEVLAEDEFAGRFKVIVFAIVEDHNTGHEHNPNGNMLPFVEEYN